MRPESRPGSDTAGDSTSDTTSDTAVDPDADDRALLAAHAAGDRAAFGRLVVRHQERLWAVAVRTLGDRDEAADALQDALLSAYRAAGSYRGDARVTTWLHRIVVNACLDRVRRRAVRPTVPLPEQERADPRDALAARETALEVEAALAGLPLDQRTAIVLVDVQGLPVAEAAAVLGVPTGTVKSRCSRGRARLALTLGHLRNRQDGTGVTPPAPRAARDDRDDREHPPAPPPDRTHDRAHDRPHDAGGGP